MTKVHKVMIALGGLTLLLGLAAGICFDCGLVATGGACVVLAFAALCSIGGAVESL